MSHNIMDFGIFFSPKAATFVIETFNIIGIIVFAMSGAIAGIRRGTDIFGVLVLGFATSSFGGISRDLLIGDTPPEVIRGTMQLYLSIASALLAYTCYSIIKKMNNPIDFLDSLGLGAFTVLGANKALNFGISPIWAITLGMITAVGGGVGRDILLARVPIILQREVYATAAVFGATIFTVGKVYIPEAESLFLMLGALGCCLLRMITLRKKWHLPRKKIANPDEDQLP